MHDEDKLKEEKQRTKQKEEIKYLEEKIRTNILNDQEVHKLIMCILSCRD